ncbi:hypothetical protein DLC15_05445 [Salmonella enterica subsp. enterica serovar Telelkebir]|nr:hypothetical protein [Salmonella enterica subsp. enterica serovar Telelkebir]EEH1523846.1 hypothetical protein [Salmonella enterica subsp. enterica serovar Telelkebir]
MKTINELAKTLRHAAEEELMCREASDTSDLWMDEASPENVLLLLDALVAETERADEREAMAKLYRIAVEAGEQRIAELEDENEYVRWRFRESDLLFAMLLITMRAAVIEKEHGEGDRAAMDWIINRLAGPGEFAPESETDAQAYFNRESEIIDSEFSACMDFFMKRNERLRATGIKVKE